MENLLSKAARLVNVAVLVTLTLFPQRTLAWEHDWELTHQHLAFLREAVTGDSRVSGIRQESDLQTRIPYVGQNLTVVASAYSSTVAETDSDPFTTASGSRPHLGTLAANFLPLGSIVRIEGETYIVEDRMHSRYDGEARVDIWMTSSEMATRFGVRSLALEIVAMPD